MACANTCMCTCAYTNNYRQITTQSESNDIEFIIITPLLLDVMEHVNTVVQST